MKKVLIVLALLALVIVPVAAENVAAIGGEAGYPASGVTLNYNIDKKWDGYVTLGVWYGHGFEAVAGMQFRVGGFNIEKAEFDINLGLQAGAVIGRDYLKVIAAGTGSISWDFSIEKTDWTLYLRLGAGAGILVKGGEEGKVTAGFDMTGALGLVYHL